MRIPQVGDVFTNPNPSDVTTRLHSCGRVFSPVTKENTKHLARQGNATWLGNRFVIRKDGVANFRYLGNCSGVAFCVLPHNGGEDAYVISTNYGGCEYHTLYHRKYRLLAFLHVMRGGNRVASPYTMAAAATGLPVRTPWPRAGTGSPSTARPTSRSGTWVRA